MDNRDEIVIGQLQRVINKLLFIKKKSMFNFMDVGFFPSEVHLMLVIREKTATNATRIAGELGVTKGAVSQTLSRLEKKGVLTKEQDPYNKNELTVTFTPFGAQALEHYMKIADVNLKKYERHLEAYTDGEKEAIRNFLFEVGKVLDEME